MVAVSTIDGIKYGFRLILYFVAVIVIAAILGGIGAVLAQDSPLVGGIVLVTGIVIFYAGFLGTLYKVIADGVKAGTNAANTGGSAPPSGGTPAGGGPAGGQQRGGRQQGGQQGFNNR